MVSSINPLPHQPILTPVKPHKTDQPPQPRDSIDAPNVSPLDGHNAANEVQTLQTATALLFRIAQCFGAAPLFDASQRWRIGAHIAWTAFCVATITASMVVHSVQVDPTRHHLQRFLFVVSFGLNTVNNVIVLFGTHLQRDAYARFTSDVRQIDERLEWLSRFGAQRSSARLSRQYAALRRFVGRSLWAMTVVFGVTIGIDFFYNDMRLDISLISIVTYLVPNMTMCLVLLQFGSGLYLLTGKYEAVNGMLERILRSGGGRAVARMSMPIMNDDDAEDDEEEDVETVSATAFAGSNDAHLLASFLETKLVAARHIYFRLNRVNERLTRSFSYVLCSVFVWTQLILTMVMFQFYKVAECFGRDDYWVMAYGVVWALVYGGRLLAVLLLGGRLNGEKRKVTALLYRMDLECERSTAGMDQGVRFRRLEPQEKMVTNLH